MKIRPAAAAVLALSALPLIAAASEPAAALGSPMYSLGKSIGYMLLFSLLGILAAIAGYKLFDKCTPGDLHQEILQNKNVAAAIVAGSVILGVCLIVAAAMIG